MINIEKFVAARKAQELSQNELAKAAGVSQQLIGGIENGLTKTTKKIHLIAKALKIPAYELDSDIPPPDKDLEVVLDAISNLPFSKRSLAIEHILRVLELLGDSPLGRTPGDD
jgi:transcriptional regulator with XRE-family HTH domain